MHFNLVTDHDAAPMVDLQERGLHYGDGLFETMLVEESGSIRYWEYHFERLQQSARRLKIPCPSKDWLERKLSPYLGSQQSVILKIILTRGSGGRGLSYPETLSPNVYFLDYPHEINQIKQSIKVTFSEITLSENRYLGGIKHLNRLEYVLATEALAQKTLFDEALLCDQQGNVVEGIVHNFFFTRDDTIFTPDVSLCGVAGVLRRIILQTLQKQRKKVIIGSFSREQVIAADECFVCNSVQGIRPVIAIDDTGFQHGPITRQLQQDTDDSKAV